jgi:SpoVK/Ycf46/Vps4 family AAA+-type ATPase
LSCEPNPKIYLDPEIYQDVETDIIKVIRGEKRKIGCLLHGSPGNGKTQFVRYLARKYSLPIYVVYLSPDYSNLDISLMFASIPKKCIVLLEDFDNYFNGRTCAMKNDSVKFTFDSIINALDGIHNDYKGVVFVMTANDIEKIDDSLKKRPSRFKYVRKFDVPSTEIRFKILGDTTLVEKTQGLSLDQVFSLCDEKLISTEQSQN